MREQCSLLNSDSEPVKLLSDAREQAIEQGGFKGQYLAVEYIFLIGLSLIMVIAAVSVFDIYREEVVETAIDGQTDAISAKMSIEMSNLQSHDNGTVEKTVELPDTIGERDYEITLAEPSDMIIDVSGEEYTYELDHLEDYDFSGSAQGGEITLYKNDDQYSVAG